MKSLDERYGDMRSWRIACWSVALTGIACYLVATAFHLKGHADLLMIAAIVGSVAAFWWRDTRR